MTIKLKPITENSWLVLGDAENVRIGLLTSVRDNYTLMAAGEKQRFLNRTEVNRYFKQNVFKSIVNEPEPEPDSKSYFISGYPVEFSNPNEVILKGNTLPLFSKKPTSEIYYSAGYYCLNFPKNWMPAFCPKLSTLESYEFVGPFKTEFEMKAELTRLRKEKTSKK